MGAFSLDEIDRARIAHERECKAVAERDALVAEVVVLRELLRQVLAEDIAAAVGHGLTLMLHTKIADVLARRS